MSATLARAVAIFYSRKKAQKITEYRDTAPLRGILLNKYLFKRYFITGPDNLVPALKKHYFYFWALFSA